MQFLFALLCLALVGKAVAYYGVDVSQRTTSSSFSCLASNNYHFAVVRVYQSSGHVDPNAVATIADAWKGGMSYVDGYLFPCFSCGNAAKQMDDTVNALSGSKYGMIWFDIEGTQYWGSNTQNNVNFLQQMVDQGKKRGVTMGIYSSASQWGPIMGSSTAFKSLPLWYAHYDNNPSFSDFKAFGGWTKANVKQYAGTTSICSASVDKNWYP